MHARFVRLAEVLQRYWEGTLAEMTVPAVEVTSPRRLRHWWLTRTLAGLAFGFGCNGAAQSCWLGLLLAVYGSLDNAFRNLKPSVITQVACAAYLASLPASFLGGLVAPLVLGASTQRRWTVVWSSVGGAALATVPAILLGAFAGWLSWQAAPHSMIFAWIAFGLGVPAGIGGGWLGGRIVRQVEPDGAAVRPRD